MLANQQAPRSATPGTSESDLILTTSGLTFVLVLIKEYRDTSIIRRQAKDAVFLTAAFLFRYWLLPHFLYYEIWREIQMGNCLYCKMEQQSKFRE